jgi:hypothetical protein
VAHQNPNGDSVLTSSGSKSKLQQVNSSRTGLTGVNKMPIPEGTVTTRPNGRMNVAASGGRNFDLRKNGTLASYSGRGEQARFRPDGHIGSVHTGTVDIHHGVHGERTVVMRRPDQSVVVRTGPRAGYVQRTVFHNNVPYVQRTFVVGLRSYTRTFSVYTYHGVMLPQYIPGFYYAPAFYSWAYYPWFSPVPYAWDWVVDPWYGYYGAYFAVSPLYSSPSLWLTDYYLGQVMASAYQLQMQSQQAGEAEAAALQSNSQDGEQGEGDPVYAPADTPITPDLKRAIADEVQQQLSYENSAAQNPENSANLTGLPQVMQPNHLFVVDAALDVAAANSASCELSPGDVLRLVAVPSDSSVTADLKVASSRRGDCPANLQVTVSLEQLQEMQNRFRAKLDSGLQALRGAQGKSGLPEAPMSAIAPPPRPVEQLPAPTEDAQAALQSAGQQADQTENRIMQSAFAPSDQVADAGQ